VQIYQIKLFGKIQVICGQQPLVDFPAKAQELLAFLLLHPQHPHTREALAVQLWENASDAHSKKYLRQTLWQLQSGLHDGLSTSCPALLIAEDGWVYINPQADVALDVATFVRAYHETQDIPDHALTEAQTQTLHQAIALYEGELLRGWYQDWCVLERERLRAMALAMLDKLVGYCLQNRHFEQGIQYAMRMLRFDNTREKTHRQLMHLYYLSGDRTSALRQYNYCVDALAQEFGARPTAITQTLHAHILADRTDMWSSYARPVEERPSAREDVLIKVLEEFKRIAADLSLLRSDVETIKQALQQGNSLS
jgi:DNA-binding SARP family transcriptional activator